MWEGQKKTRCKQTLQSAKLIWKRTCVLDGLPGSSLTFLTCRSCTHTYVFCTITVFKYVHLQNKWFWSSSYLVGLVCNHLPFQLSWPTWLHDEYNVFLTDDSENYEEKKKFKRLIMAFQNCTYTEIWSRTRHFKLLNSPVWTFRCWNWGGILGKYLINLLHISYCSQANVMLGLRGLLCGMVLCGAVLCCAVLCCAVRDNDPWLCKPLVSKWLCWSPCIPDACCHFDKYAAHRCPACSSPLLQIEVPFSLLCSSECTNCHEYLGRTFFFKCGSGIPCVLV